jgi:hypothetical protein
MRFDSYQCTGASAIRRTQNRSTGGRDITLSLVKNGVNIERLYNAAPVRR